MLDPVLATARSSLPSPLTSPAATKLGLMPPPKARAAWKDPSPLPSSTETVLALSLATARSSLPSPLKSPAATDAGVAPDVKSLGAMNDTVWADAWVGNATQKSIVAAPSSDSQAEF